MWAPGSGPGLVTNPLCHLTGLPSGGRLPGHPEDPGGQVRLLDREVAQSKQNRERGSKSTFIARVDRCQCVHVCVYV